MAKETKNLMDGLFEEMNRVRELIKIYESLPGGVGFFASSLMRQGISEAERSIRNNNVIEMMAAYQTLTEFEE